MFKNFFRSFWHIFYVGFIYLLMVLGGRSLAGQYLYQGLYKWGDVLPTFCEYETCNLSLPIDFLETSVALSVDTEKRENVLNSFKLAARASGWLLEYNKKSGFKAEPLQAFQRKVYISCLDSNVKEIEDYKYFQQLKSDSLKCFTRDSLRAHYNDSVQNYIAPAPLKFKNYELRYYAVNRSFANKYGFEWSQIIASGNLRTIPKFYDDFKVFATENNDSSFSYRSIRFSIDSSLVIDWGNEENVINKTYTESGIVTQAYEWRKFGLVLSLSRDSSKVRLNYTFRDKENNGLLQGQSMGTNEDTLVVSGDYSYNRTISSGLPILCNIPMIGPLFSTKTNSVESKYFVVYLVPLKNED